MAESYTFRSCFEPYRTTLSLIIRHQISLTDATGGEDGSRTHDLLNAIQTLSQTELQPHIVIPKTVCNQSLDASRFSLRTSVEKKRVLCASSLVARHKVSTPTFMVPKAGLEPARPKPPDFESGTSTNSITRANDAPHRIRTYISDLFWSQMFSI